MTHVFLFVSFLYAVFGLGVWLFERRRMRRSGPDTITVFVVLLLLQCCLPGIVIYGLLPFVDATAPTGNDVFDGILQATDPTTALLVLSMTVWFAVFLYVGIAVGRLAIGSHRAVTPRVPTLSLEIQDGRLLMLLAAGLAVTLWSFYLMGDSVLSRYVNLVLFRAGFEGIERNALNANAFALTQAWSWLGVVAVFAVREWRGRGTLWIVCVAFIVIFALLGVSRRAIFLPILLGYLTLVLSSGGWRIRWVLAASFPLLLLVAFGKETLASIAWGGSFERVAGIYESRTSPPLRAMSDVGITIVESLGTLKSLHMHLRYGIDHILAVAQRFPEGMFGLDLHFPERIVRISTAAFADESAQDIPPGLLGQMWLDFGVFGPLVWGLMFGLQMSVVTELFERTRRTLQSSAVFVVLVFVIALPLNTGSFDFTFSIDIFAVLLGLLWCVRLRRRVDQAASTPTPIATMG